MKDVDLDLESLAKGAALTAFLAYVLGLLATARYLERLDVPLPDLIALQPRFIYTGGLVLACFALSGLLPFFAWGFAKLVADALERGRPARWAIAAAGIVAAVFAEWLGYRILIERDQSHITPAGERAAIWLTLSANGVGLLPLALAAAIRAREHRASRVGLLALVLVALVAVFLSVFSGSILPVSRSSTAARSQSAHDCSSRTTRSPTPRRLASSSSRASISRPRCGSRTRPTATTCCTSMTSASFRSRVTR
jgi:O-antigen ligase